MGMYKIVYTEEGKASSIFAYGRARTYYEKDIWAEAPSYLVKEGYGLCVFETEDDAFAFIPFRNRAACEIWECEVEEKLELLPPLSLYAIAVNLDCFDKSYYSYTGIQWPKGTQMFKRIKLTKKIWSDKE